MDTAADGLLALSNLAAATAERVDLQDDDRSSSLSELDEPLEIPELEEATAMDQIDGDSEAETERIEESPDKLRKKPFGISPSKLVQSMTADERPEIEALTDSAVSSPISPLDESAGEESDAEAGEDTSKLMAQPYSNKRKRLSDVYDTEDQQRIRRRRTGSIDTDKDGAESEEDEVPGRVTREPTIEPLDDGIDAELSEIEDEEQEQEQARPQEQEPASASDEGKSKKIVVPSRSTRRRGKELLESEPHDIDEDSDREEGEDDADVDDAEVQAKSEEERKHFSNVCGTALTMYRGKASSRNGCTFTAGTALCSPTR